MFLLLVGLAAWAASPILGRAVPGSCPPVSPLWTYYPNLTALADDHRDWSYRVISYDPLEYNVFTMFHYGSNPLECIQIDFRPAGMPDASAPRRLGELWFRCTDDSGEQVERIIPFYTTGLGISITPSKFGCIPKIASYTMVRLFVIEGRHLLFATCRNEDPDRTKEQLHHTGHLLLSEGPVEDDKRLLEVAGRLFNQSFEPWLAKEVNRRACNCTAYKQFLSDVFALECQPLDYSN